MSHPVAHAQHLAEQLYGITLSHRSRTTKLDVRESYVDGARFCVVESHHQEISPDVSTPLADRKKDVRTFTEAYRPGDVGYIDLADRDFCRPRAIAGFIAMLTTELAERDAAREAAAVAARKAREDADALDVTTRAAAKVAEAAAVDAYNAKAKSGASTATPATKGGAS